MRKPGRGQILENRLVGPREVLGGGDRRVPAKGRGRTAPCRGRSGASWIWATPLTPARARGSSVRATPSLRPPRILKTSLFLQKGGPRKEPSQRTATALFYLIPCGDFQLSPREFYLSLITIVTNVWQHKAQTADSFPQHTSDSVKVSPAALYSTVEQQPVHWYDSYKHPRYEMQHSAIVSLMTRLFQSRKEDG